MPKTMTGGEMYRAGLPGLGARLLAAAGMVRPGAPVADIGCDHGKLAVWLALHGHRVVAVDLRPLPLARAKALVAQTGCEDLVDCRLGDGLAPMAPGEVEDIIIAGVSGETAAAILAAAPWVQNEAVRLVLVPAMRTGRLRRWLCEAGFALQEECCVLEAGRPYTVMRAAYTGAAHTPTPLFCEMGLLRGQGTPAVAEYARRRVAHLGKKLAAPLAAEERLALEELIREVEGCQG